MIGHQQAHAAGQGITGLKTQLQLDSTGEPTPNGAQENGKDDPEVRLFVFHLYYYILSCSTIYRVSCFLLFFLVKFESK